MYVGRFVGAGLTVQGAPFVVYRVSSRSFPNRRAVQAGDTVTILPRGGSEADVQTSPYISYTALAVCGPRITISNGTHTDIIANKLGDGLSPRDALMQTLVAMDYEHDANCTPRIAAVMDATSKQAWLGVITPHGVHVRPFDLLPNRLWYVATNESQNLKDDQYLSPGDFASAHDAAKAALGAGEFKSFSHPVSACAAIYQNGRWSVATANA